MTWKVVPQYRARRHGERTRNEEVNAELNKAIPARVGVEGNKGDFKILRTHRPCVYHFTSSRKNHKSWAFRRAFTRNKRWCSRHLPRDFLRFHTKESRIRHFQSVVMTKSSEKKIFLRMIRLYTSFQWISPRFRIKVARDCFISEWNLLFSTLFALRPLLDVRFRKICFHKRKSKKLQVLPQQEVPLRKHFSKFKFNSELDSFSIQFISISVTLH